MNKTRKLVFIAGALVVLGVSLGLVYFRHARVPFSHSRPSTALRINSGGNLGLDSGFSARGGSASGGRRNDGLAKFQVDVSKPYEGQALDMKYEAGVKMFGRGTNSDDPLTLPSPLGRGKEGEGTVPESVSAPSQEESPLQFVNKQRMPIVESQLAASLQDLGVEEGHGKLPLTLPSPTGRGKEGEGTAEATSPPGQSPTKFGTKTKKGWGQAEEESSLLLSAPSEELKTGTPHSKFNLNPASEQSKRASKLARQRQVNIFKEQGPTPEPKEKLEITQEEEKKLKEQIMLMTSAKIAKVISGIGTPMELSDVIGALAQVSMEGRGHSAWNIAGKILDESGSSTPGAFLETTGVSNLLVANAGETHIGNPKNKGIRFEAEKGTYAPGAGMSKTLREEGKGKTGGGAPKLPGGAKIGKEPAPGQDQGQAQQKPPLQGFDFSGYEYRPADPKFICPICGTKALDVFAKIGGGQGASTLNAKVGLNKTNVSSLGDFMSASWSLK